MALNLYLVERDDAEGPDEHRAHVIAAADAYSARLIAARKSAMEGYHIWLEESTSVSIVGVATDDLSMEVVLSDYVR